MRKIITIVLVGIMAVTMFAGCSTSQPAQDQQTSQDQQTAQPTKTYKIGINNFGLANFFARIGKDTMESEIAKQGAECVASVTADVNSRTAAIEDMISQGVDAIIIQEGDISQVAPALQEAKDKGIVIASLGAGDDPDFVDLYVASNETEFGTLAAEQMVKFMGGKGKVCEIYNDAGAMIRMRKDAMHEVIKAYPDITVPYGFVYAWPDFFPDIKAKMEALIQAHPNPGDIAGVFATFDGAGYASAAAFREAGLQDSVVIVGIDGDPEAYKEMALPDSPFKATVAQDPATMAVDVVQGVIDILNGKQVERTIEVPGVVVTKDNLAEMMAKTGDDSQSQ